MSGEEQGKRWRDALCDVTRPQGLPNRLCVELSGAGRENQTGANLLSLTKEPVYRLIYDQLIDMQFLYDVKIIRHALIQYPFSGVGNGLTL